MNYAVTLPPEEKIIRGFAVRDFRDDLNMVLVSRKGQIKRTKLSSYPVSRLSKTVRAMKIFEGDALADVVLTSGNSDLIIFSENGFATRYNENAITISSTSSAGVKAGNFKGSPITGLVAINPEEKAKILLITSLAHKRVFSSNNIDAGERMGKLTVIFRTFKSEPHTLVYCAKAPEKEPPVSFDVVLKDGGDAKVTFEDLNLTPIERYAKKDDSWKKKDVISLVQREDSDFIDANTVSFAPPVVEIQESAEEASEAEGESAPEILRRQYDQPAEKFEQISIFDDDDF